MATAETEDCNEVAAAVNEIAREEIGVEIELVRGSNTTDQVNLAMTSGEDIDLLQLQQLRRPGHDGTQLLGLPRWTTLWKNMDRAL